MKSIALISVVVAALVLPQAAAANGSQDQFVISGDVDVPRGKTVGDVFVIDGAVNVAGRVDGDLVAVAGPVRVAGVVDGDVTVLSDRATLLPRARVTGDLRYGDEEPVVAPSASVGGEVSDEGWDQLQDFPWGIVGALAWWVAVSVSTLVLGLVLLVVAPRAAEAALGAARERLGVVVALGAGIFVGLPIVAVIAVATLVGIPLGLGLLLALVPLAALAYVTSCYLVGRAILRRPVGAVVPFLVGWGLLRLVALVPVLGALVWLVAVIVGLGALTLALWRARQPSPAAAVPAGGPPPHGASA